MRYPLDEADIDARDKMLDSALLALVNKQLTLHQVSSGLKEVFGQMDSGNRGGAQDWFKNGLEHMSRIKD